MKQKHMTLKDLMESMAGLHNMIVTGYTTQFQSGFAQKVELRIELIQNLNPNAPDIKDVTPDQISGLLELPRKSQ